MQAAWQKQVWQNPPGPHRDRFIPELSRLRSELHSTPLYVYVSKAYLHCIG